MTIFEDEVKTRTLSQNSAQYSAPALEKGLDIIELLSASENGLTQGEIARALNRSSNEIYRMLTTLVRRRYILRPKKNDRYVLSLRLFSLSHGYPPLSRLINFSVPLMEKVAK